MTEKKILDTNIIVRFLTNDDPVKANKIEKLLSQADIDELVIPDVIIAEIVWVLLSFYSLTKEEVIEKLEGLINFPAVKTNKPVLQRAISFYRRHNISYVDAYLAAYAQRENVTVYSYDERLYSLQTVDIQKP